MSRIWDELKEAEKKEAEKRQARPPRLPLVEHAPAAKADNRKSKRSKTSSALLVYGSDEQKHPFHEETAPFDVSEGGCLITLKTEVTLGQRLFLVNTSNQDEQECRVIRIDKVADGQRQIAVEFLRPSPEFWFDR